MGSFEVIYSYNLKQSISNFLLKTIKNEIIEHTDFVSVFMNKTMDTMSKSQLSTILRYIMTNE